MPGRNLTFSEYDDMLSRRECEPLLTQRRGRSITFTEATVAADAAKSQTISDKLGTFDGVFIPTTLNVLSILMFLRFGFIIGQAGFLGTILLLLISYLIDTLSVLSISAIATNGTVRGGGAYYMISRSLGPEFGGSIGVIFYIGQVLNAALNVVGFVIPLVSNFGKQSGAIAKILPESSEWIFCYQTLLLWTCLLICVVGPSLFARSSKLLFYVLIAATLSLPISTLFVKPYFSPEFNAWYTGPSWSTFAENMLPHFTRGAAGSEIKGKENFRDLFSVFFPATAGIFAGASMSGDLKSPSKSIPKGTLSGLGLTFILYFLVILGISSSCSRDLLYRDIEVMRDSNISPYIIVMGEFATSLFSAMMGILGAAKLLQAISRDNIIPGISAFGSGTKGDDNPIAAIILTYALAQVTILLPINKIAIFITMAFLVTFVVTNVACLLLRISAAPNFRPSFKYFSATTAAFGTISSLLAMFVADGPYASSVLLLTLFLFIGIHYYTPPKPWGDVSQGLIYHQVRKYLLKLRFDHVKYWRPQILLLVDDPRTSWSLIKFCSHLKKGGLFILGHVVIVQDFTRDYPEVERQTQAWRKLRDACNIKAFVQISACNVLAWGVRNIVLGSGLGGMKTNITVMGFYDENDAPEDSEIDHITVEPLPTDACRSEQHLSVSQWVQVIEDLLVMKSTVAIAKGFNNIEYPTMANFNESKLSCEKGFIDLYPIQMSAVLLDNEGKTNGLSINFDTYTLILQLGAILHTVPVWKKTHNLRVLAFVEQEDEVEKETKRIKALLEKLRIPAMVKVVPLEKNNYCYNVIINGAPDTKGTVDDALKDLKWWHKLKKYRKVGSWGRSTSKTISSRSENANQASRYVLPDGSLSKRRTLSQLEQMGISHSLNVSTMIRANDLNTFYDSEDEHESSEEEEITHNEPRVSFGSTPIPQRNDIIGDNQPDPDDEPSFVCEDGRASILFNDIPGKAQHLILNELMRHESKDSVVLFTTLPAPALGTHMHERRSEEYLDLLETFCDGLPPCLLIHSQSMTVTTAL